MQELKDLPFFLHVELPDGVFRDYSVQGWDERDLEVAIGMLLYYHDWAELRVQGHDATVQRWTVMEREDNGRPSNILHEDSRGVRSMPVESRPSLLQEITHARAELRHP